MKSGESVLEHLDLLNKIIAAEQQASLISSAAKQKRDNLPNELRHQQETLRAEYLARAEKRISTVQQQSDQQADEQIAQLDAQLQQRKTELESYFTQHHDRMVAELFRLVVSSDAQ